MERIVYYPATRTLYVFDDDGDFQKGYVGDIAERIFLRNLGTGTAVCIGGGVRKSKHEQVITVKKWVSV